MQDTNFYTRFGKRVFDLVGTALLLLLLWWLYPVLALAVGCALGRPVLFVQVRPGKNGVLFRLYKFRTMTEARDETGALLPDGERLTPFGRFLRSTSLDELPELYNVLRGEMSLVGPRPLLPQYLPLYSPRQARRHALRPGITGWAQVNGRNRIPWEEKLELDVWYTDHASLLLDLRILLLTLPRMFRRDGIAAEGFATAEEFKGSVGMDHE